MSKLVDEMIAFFKNVKTLDTPARIKENLVLRAAEIKGLKGFEAAADAELNFMRVTKQLSDELNLLKIRFEAGGGDMQYCPELDRFLMYAKMVRAELSQISGTLLDPDLRALLSTKRDEAIASQLALLNLQAQRKVVDVDQQSQIVPPRPFWEVASEFCKTNQTMRGFIRSKWVKLTKTGQSSAVATAEVPDQYEGDVEVVEGSGSTFFFVSEKWFNEQTIRNFTLAECTLEKIQQSARIRMKRAQGVNRKYALAVLGYAIEKFDLSGSNVADETALCELLFKDPSASVDPILKAGTPTSYAPQVQKEAKKSHRHAVEKAAAVAEFVKTDKLKLDGQAWKDFYQKKGETFHLSDIVAKCLKAAVPVQESKRQPSRGTFEVELLYGLLDKISNSSSASEIAKKAVHSSIEAMTLFSEFANTVPDRATMIKDPSTLLQVQGLDTAAVKQLSDKTGYRIVFPVLNVEDMPDSVHLVAHQVLNPYLLDIMHRSPEFKKALERSWETFKEHTQGRQLVKETLQGNNPVKTFRFA